MRLRIYILTIIGIFSFTSNTIGQKLNEQDTLNRTKQIQLEVGGKCLYWSINYIMELRSLTNTQSYLSFGFGYTPFTDYSNILFLNSTYMLDFRKNKTVQPYLFIGITPTINFLPYPSSAPERKFYRENKNVDSIAGDNYEPILNYWVTPGAGLKFILNKTLNLRISYNPLINYSKYRNNFTFFHWCSLSLNLKLK